MAGFRFLLRNFTLRSLLRNRLRSALTVLGIMLGVAILLAINLANHTALERFRQSVDIVSGQTNLEILPTAAVAMDEVILADLHWIWDEGGTYAPVLVQTAVAAEGGRGIMQVLGVDMVSDYRHRPFQWADGGEPDDPLSIFNRNRLYTGYEFAKDRGLRVGSTLPLLINDRVHEFTVAGILAQGGLGAVYDGNLLLMDISTAQVVYDFRGRINRIDLIVPDDRLAEVKARLADTLPDGLTVQSPERRGQQVAKMLRAFQLNLMALSFIALLVAMFLIYNTMSISVIRRRPEIGTLRALGTPRRRIMALFLLEALVQGVVGSLLGVGLGILLAFQAVEGVSATVETLYTGMPVTGVDVSAAVVLRAFFIGVGLTLLAALPPVFEAASVHPAEATRRAQFESRILQVSGKLPLVSIILWALAFWASGQPPVEGFPVFGHAASLLTVLGFALVMPLVLMALFRVLRPVMRFFFGAEGALSVENLKGSLGRTSVAVASLMVAIAMTVSLAVMIGSFRETVKVWVQQSITADIWIEPLWRKLNTSRRLSPEISGRLAQIEGVAFVDDFLEFPIEYGGDPANLAVGDFDVFAQKGNLIFLDGEPTRQVIERAICSQGAIITEPFAYRHGIGKGDTVTLDTPRGEAELLVEGVYYDYASELGYIVIPWTVYHQYYEDHSLSGIALYLDEGADAAVVRREIVDALGGETRVSIMTRQGLREEVLRVFDETFAITYALHVISITVAILGIMNALFTLVLESRREFGILKYIGATAGQIRKMVLIEAGVLGLLGNFAGLAVGFLLSFLLIYVINRQSFGWTIQFAVPLDFLVQTFLLIMVTAILSGLFPARLAAKTVAPAVLREE